MTLRHATHWWPTATCICLVLYATLMPHPLPDGTPTGWLAIFGRHADKVVHAVMMGGVTGACIFDFIRRGQRFHYPPLRFYLYLTAAMTAFSALTELAQQAMQMGRSGDFADFGADIGGTATALLLAPPVCRILFRHQNAA